MTDRGVGDRTPDPDDAAAWVAARGPALRRFAYLLTGDADLAGDLVQEALSRAYPRWHSLAQRGTTEAYLRRCVTNASVSRWRARRRLVLVEDPEPLVREHRPDPTAGLADAEVAWALVGTLPPRQRAAVVLRFYEDLDFRQIGAVLGCPPATARSHVHRAVVALRIRLEEENDDE